MSKKSEKETKRAEAITRLRKIIKPGAELGVIAKNVARSGMSRDIAVLTCRKDGIQNISGLVADALEWRWDDEDAVKVGGAGMDMGFHLIHTLGTVLYPKGGCYRRKDGEKKCEENGGYLLKHRWL